ALAQHDELDCAADAAHGELERALQETILHRLDTVSPDHHDAVEALCVRAPRRAATDAAADDAALCGYAEGLLLRSGCPVPLVLSAVRAAIPVRRLAELTGPLAAAQHGADSEDPDFLALAEEI